MNNNFYNASHMISNMLDEGYIIEQLSVNSKIYYGNEIKYVDFLNCICITFNSNEIIFIPYDKIDFIIIKEG